MRAVVQRVSRASVQVDGETVGAIGRGLLVLLAVATTDGDEDVAWMVRKLSGLRIFPDDEGRLNRSVQEVGGAILLVSQFTLYGDARRGRRPSFTRSASGEKAQELYEAVAAGLRELGLTVAQGRFGAHMDVELVNDGPVTLLLSSEGEF
ncbi:MULTISPECIES: D-aminoacyl-tRNA deacylase [Limnochorda]|uniref:D-aminoacyl-tRNA deacylase n=1 Tax=Limnochorda TaxID=1676651 RepID=UPI00179AF175|nr:D-aminoacyl-tRNA deacylase [Limnochorda pilosa]MBO2487075.1 D-tyrosyl-tRNA(Tyr) deacylase [Bacillota bacterium]MBO2519582.1 D-tyrosyl-tRNA(Tyr) deacylase [Bacillota bacterium]NMA71094.1 D-tyrosyl-tRNA(Tyr) deacylase [Bacillota bacterium]